MKTFLLIITLFVLIINSSFSQSSELENSRWKLSVNDDGTVKALYFKQSNTLVKFTGEKFAGPSWYLEQGDKVFNLKSKKDTDTKFLAKYKNIDLSLEYKDDNGKLLFLATLKNNGHTPFQPNKLGLRIGINTYMDKYPDWEDKLFPTLLRCEPTHFWGYFMGTTGKIIAIASPDPIASWSHNYSTGWGTPPYQFIGHRITSVNLDLINALPLPERHPQNLWQILPGETKTFRIYLEEVSDLNGINKTITELTKAPTIEMGSTTCEKGGEIDFSVLGGKSISVRIHLPNGTSIMLQPKTKNNYLFKQTNLEGLYYIKVFSENRKHSEASFYVRKPYSWYMQNAMQAILDFPQKASKSHCESWYGFYTTYSGGVYFPENKTIAKADEHFQKIFPMFIDTVNFEPIAYKHRIQNESTLIGILVDRYQLFNDNSDLDKALKLSEFIINTQTPDGAYRAGKTHYTSVVYPAKSLMELMEAIKGIKKYKSQYNKIYASVKLAMDELVRNGANIETEGQLTFEDGMISCSALQLGQFALLQTDKNEKDKYRDASSDLLTQHQCLEQLIIPDARMRSASLRFWEAQYDVLMYNNFFNSPHGWSSWSTYAYYYLYLLTDDIKYLIRTFNGLDAAMQMIDLKNGKLRWAFAVNPYLKITQVKENIEGATPLNYQGVHYHAKKYPSDQYIIGEQYVDMVSDWFFANDNDVHEHFKCLEEVALGKAFVAEKESGEILTFNCKATIQNNKITVVPDEDIIKRVHINFKSNFTVKVQFASKTIIQKVNGQSKWLSLDK